MPRRTNTFRLQGQRFALTYPQAPSEWTTEHVRDSLITKLESSNIIVTQWMVCRELHADGHPHYHIYLLLATRLDVTGDTAKRFFDIDGKHGNYQVCKSPRKWTDYVAKAGEYIDSGFYTAKVTWADAISASTKEDFLSTIAKADPKTFITMHDKIESYADKHFTKPSLFTPEYDLSEFNPPIDLSEWLEQWVGGTPGRRSRSLVLSGPTRMGKTEFIRTWAAYHQFTIVYLHSMYDLSSLPVARPDLIIFDDFDWTRFRDFNWKIWFGTHPEFTTTDKYHRKRVVQWGKGVPFIWLCNEEQNPFDIENGAIHQYISENTDHIKIVNKLY